MQNPYASPTAEDHDEPANAHRGVTRLMTGWTVAVLANLPMPFMIGIGMVDGAALAGVVTAIFIVIAAGLLMIRIPDWCSESITRGTLLVAATQVIPLLQMLAGMLAIEFTRSVGLLSLSDDAFMDAVFEVTGFSTGLVAALVTWSILLAIATVAGFFLRLVLPDKWWRHNPGVTMLDTPT